MESNAEYQSRKRMTREEKARGAIERVAGNIKTFETEARGREVTGEECMARAQEIARRAERENNG